MGWLDRFALWFATIIDKSVEEDRQNLLDLVKKADKFTSILPSLSSQKLKDPPASSFKTKFLTKFMWREKNKEEVSFFIELKERNPDKEISNRWRSLVISPVNGLPAKVVLDWLQQNEWFLMFIKSWSDFSLEITPEILKANANRLTPIGVPFGEYKYPQKTVDVLPKTIEGVDTKKLQDIA